MLLAVVAAVTAMGQAGGGGVSGRVTDDEGAPLVGVYVIERGTDNHAVTDLDGNFSISTPAGRTLMFSYVGFTNKAVTATDGMTVVLSSDLNDLDEVVVVGYGTSKRRDLIASVSTVKADDISNIPTTNISQGLAGRSPGLIVVASGGGINSQPTISIRGGGTPLYVIDGIVRSEADFRNLSADDIESMSILKDASATAIYGSRASNGIVQVVTKGGQSGRVSIEYDLNLSWSQPSTWPDKLHSPERAEWANRARANDGRDPLYSDAAIRAMRDGSDPRNYSDTDWRRMVLNDWAPQQKHTVRASGGTDASRFYVSLGHIRQNSLYKSDNHWMKRTNFRLANTSNVRPIHLQVKASIDGYRQKTTHPNTSSASSYFHVFSHINDRPPTLPGVNDLGLPYNITDNPVAETAADAGYNRTTDNVVNGKGELVWSSPLEGLQVRVASDYRFYSSTTKQWRKDAAKYDWGSNEPNYDNLPQLYHSSSTGYEYTNQAFVQYDGLFGANTVSFLGGYEQYYTKGETYWERRVNYAVLDDQIESGPIADLQNGGSESEQGRAAWIWNLKYNYAEKYYGEFSMRNDGSDYFAPGKRWGTFFSGSLGWVITEEAFMAPVVERDIFNSFKLRGSYGETGLDSSAGRFAYLQTYSLDNRAYVAGGSFVPGFTEGGLPSPDLTWYTTRQTDVGFDFTSLDNRLYGSFDWFYYSTKGYLMAPTGESYLNQIIGVSLPQVKSNSEFRRQGAEVQVGWRDRAGDFKYDVSFNITWYNSLWARDRSESEASQMNPYRRSQQQRQDYYGLMLHNLGFYASAQDVYQSAGIANNISTGYMTAGDIKYEDTNGDGLIDSNDNRRLGNRSTPLSQYGLDVRLGWRGIYLNMLFQGASSFDMRLEGSNTMQTGQTQGLPVLFDYQTDHWRPDNRNAKYPRLMSNTGLNNNNNYATSDFWLINGRYLRMKDFQVGYDFKHTLLRDAAWLSKLKVGMSGQNIFTISRATKYGLDPENAATTGYAYPVERVLAFTLNLGF